MTTKQLAELRTLASRRPRTRHHRRTTHRSTHRRTNRTRSITMSTIRKNLRAVVVDEEDIAYTITDDTAESGYITIETQGTEIQIPQEAIGTIIDATHGDREPGGVVVSDLLWLLRWLMRDDEVSIEVYGNCAGQWIAETSVTDPYDYSLQVNYRTRPQSTPLRALRNLSRVIRQAEA